MSHSLFLKIWRDCSVSVGALTVGGSFTRCAISSLFRGANPKQQKEPIKVCGLNAALLLRSLLREVCIRP